MSVTVTVSVDGGNLIISGSAVRSEEGYISQGPTTLNAGAAGALSTRTDNDTGVVTLTAGHGQTDGTYDVFWTNADGSLGCRYGMDGTFVSDDVTLDGGAGDNLPAEDAEVVICKVVEIDMDVTGDQVSLMAAGATRRANLHFVEAAGGAIVAWQIAAGDAKCWKSLDGTANPFASKTVGKVLASSGETTASTVSIICQYDNVA